MESMNYKECFDFINTHKQKKPQIEQNLLYAELDGKPVKILNPYIERPSIFRGKGRNDNEGRIKRQITAE